ncbi:MAG TPA: molybdopterin-binding protein [Pseudomonadales bacterium]|jgi:molybdenum cofactor synthesis domain-containing protein|nr:competence/damage-inducible protein A [Gammaproteobacteria bacterium]MDP6024540.1 molybdopterin-binding protein [Pseudomonadales bacterium]MDP6316584.1 molybdopterin-binding protein [Pseudomonadales bacterium]MDP7315979.1 molybdopterin-binding protein [Pseudomonadales bacterium]MDP7576783.1 molybdopterin-binding protein [Pseudomonadales bacterium]|tara:strand:+ start:6113 stop:6862 length:750 start_codon:yes stop_codon:yes gene_type:complete
MASKTVTGCMIIIGNEILSGRTQDTNLNYLAKSLNELGVRLTEARVIPDIEDVIVDTVNECRVSFDYVFTTGGIGPTHDDITAACIAKAFDTELEMHPDIVEVIQRREAPPEVMKSRLLMARVPKGGTLIDNPTGGPQGFQMGNVFVMAGVPMVMQAMVSSLDGDRIKGGKPVRSRSIGAYLAESQVAGKLAVIQNEHPDVDLGSYPFYRKDGYGTNLVMRGTDESELDEMKDKVRAMIVSFGAEPFEE